MVEGLPKSTGFKLLRLITGKIRSLRRGLIALRATEAITTGSQIDKE